MKITRSEFLRWTMASSGLLSGGSQAKANPLGLPIGLQPYTVRKQLESDFLGTLKKVYDMGYREIELSGGPAYDGFYGQKPPEVKRRATPFSAASVPDQVDSGASIAAPTHKGGGSQPATLTADSTCRAGRSLCQLCENSSTTGPNGRLSPLAAQASGDAITRAPRRPMWLPTCWATGASSPSSGESSNGQPPRGRGVRRTRRGTCRRSSLTAIAAVSPSGHRHLPLIRSHTSSSRSSSPSCRGTDLELAEDRLHPARPSRHGVHFRTTRARDLGDADAGWTCSRARRPITPAEPIAVFSFSSESKS